MKLAEKNRKVNRSSSSHKSNAGQTPFFQPKLEVGQPGDQFEQEADSMADKVVGQINGSSVSFFSPVSNQFSSVNNSFIQNTESEQTFRDEEEDVIQKQSSEEDEFQQSLNENASPEIQKAENNNIITSTTPAVDVRMLSENPSEMDEEFAEEEGMVQTKSDKMYDIPQDFESGLNSSRSGSPLPDATKSQMETGFGADFSNIRIHTDSNAIQMSQQISAQAFTHGNNIYFNEGKFNPSTSPGQHLLAHELTHTVQQGASVQRKMIQKEGEDKDSSDTDNPQTTEEGIYTSGEKKVDTIHEKIVIPNLSVPPFKKKFLPETDLVIGPRNSERPNTQREVWENQILKDESGFSAIFNRKVFIDNAPETMFGGDRIFYLSLKGNEKNIILGNLESIKTRVSRPYWDKDGNYVPHDVDHKIEIQLGGSNTIDNMWLLEANANRSSGSQIKNSKKNQIESLLNEARPFLLDKTPSPEKIKTEYEITVKQVLGNLNEPPQSGQFWEKDQVEQGEPLEGLNFLTEGQIEEQGLRGSPSKLVLFTGSVGGKMIEIPWNEEARSSKRRDGLDIFLGKRGGAVTGINSVIYNSTEGEPKLGGTGNIICTFPMNESVIERRTGLAFSIVPLPGVSYGGLIERSSIARALEHALELKYLSPITLSTAELDADSGLSANGIVAPTIPIIANAEIGIEINEQGVRIFKTFTSNDLNFPSPFEIRECNLTVFIEPNNLNLGISGQISFGIENVGEGYIGATDSTSGGFELEGAFNFDSELFDPAGIRVEYKENIWTIGGAIGIPQGKIRGIKRATIHADYSENTFSADGEAELDIPGINKGTMEVVYGEDGFSMSGEFNLNNDIPGISSGRVTASVAKAAEEEGYRVSVTGTAVPAIPGIHSELAVGYENGALTISGRAAYNRGMLSGEINIGVTNRSIGDDGAPSGEPDGTLRVYGGGRLTLRLTPWLQAIAGVQFLPNGEIEVVGEIGIPNTVDIFGRKAFDKNLFNAPTIEIPIFAIPLGPKSLGVVAQISGGLDFSAGFGPGQLRELNVGIRYNPDREQETTITGRGLFVIPADAGLTLRGNLGLGVSIAIASLTGGIELAGTLGLEGEASAGVDVNWSPQTGLSLDATGSVMVNTKFTFDINAYARASLDLLITSISETWRYNLASFSWGPDIQFGIVFPVHYKEGEPFDMSFDDIEVVYSDLDIIAMAKNLGVSIKNRLFD